MNSLYPLKFVPQLKDKIWGGTKLRDLLNKDASDKAGESWEISGVPENLSVVGNGFLVGNNISELTEVYMGELVGEAVFEKFGLDFPLLIKFIDANDDLSIQVHPGDELAMERHNSFGKTEMWYVMQSEPGSELISGFNKVISKEEYLKYLEENKIKKIMNFEKANPGDVFFMPAGRVHAIGKGILLAEIQQTSDITYRIYDWDRMDDSGKPRELHTEQALDAIDFKYHNDYRTKYNIQENKTSHLVRCNYFTTNILDFNKAIEKDYHLFDSFVIYICTEGDCHIRYGGEENVALSKGETVLIPADLKIITLVPEPNATILEVYADQKIIDIPHGN